MASKFDRLRAGEIVEIEPGRKGRLNLENKSFETSDGRTMYVGDDPDFFPPNEDYLKTSRERERINKQVKGRFGGEFIHQFANQGALGAGVDWYNKFTQHGDDYTRTKKVKSEISQKISERSPWTSGAATAASIGTDIALTRGMSALKAAPLLAAVHAGPRIIEEPTQVAGEVAASAAGGWLLGKVENYINKATSRRGVIQALPAQQEAVIAENVLGKKTIDEANVLQNQGFNTAKENVKNYNKDLMYQHGKDLNARENQIIGNKNIVAGQEAGREANILSQKNQIAKEKAEENILKNNVKTINESRLEQYERDLANRQNKLIEKQNARAEAQTLRDAKILELENEASLAKRQKRSDQAILDREYSLAKEAANAEEKASIQQFKSENAEYEKALEKLPEMQRKVQQEYSENVVKNAEKISQSFPKDAKISSDSFGSSEFIEDYVNKSGLAGSSEANKAKKIIQSIFGDGKILEASEIAKRYKALESVIQKSSPEIKNVLIEFKDHLGRKIPKILADNMAYNKIIGVGNNSPLKNQIQKQIELSIKNLKLPLNGRGGQKEVLERAKDKANNLLKEINSTDFIKKWESGEIKNQILDSFSLDDFMSGINDGYGIKSLGITEKYVTDTYSKYYNNFINDFEPKLNKILNKANDKIITTDIDAVKRLGGSLKKTLGISNEITPPIAPQSPNPINIPKRPDLIPEIPAVQYPENIPHVTKPPLPQRPELMDMPSMNKTVFQSPPNVIAPEIPPIPPKPQLMNNPATPIPQTFNPQAIPELPVARGFAEQTGDFLEKDLLGGRGVVNNPIAKLAGLKYLLGKGALPAELAYAGMKGLTSPTAGGEVARMTFKQGGIQAIESWAQRYPSYHDGILENPQERRSLTKEIEDAQDISLEQKAILQSKVNRGKALSQKL